MRPRPPDVGPRKAHTLPGRHDFPAFAVILNDRMVLRTPYNAELVDTLKQIPSKVRSFVKDGRMLESILRKHLEANEEYFSSQDELASNVSTLVDRIADARGLSDSWVVSLAAPEIFDWALAAALKSFPEMSLHDVRVLDPD